MSRKNISTNIGKITVFVTSLILIGVITMGSTYAYYHKEANELTNTFTLGKITTEILEEFDARGNKAPLVINTDVTDCIVRMRYDISPNNPNKELIELNIENSKFWEKDNDGFYYYMKVLAGKKGDLEDKTQPLFTTYKLTNDGKEFFANSEFQIILYQEAVQAELIDDSGMVITPYVDGNFDLEKAKQMFDYYN